MRFVKSWKATKKRPSHGVGNKFYLSNKKDGALVFHQLGTLSLLLIIIRPIFYNKFTIRLLNLFPLCWVQLGMLEFRRVLFDAICGEGVVRRTDFFLLYYLQLSIYFLVMRCESDCIRIRLYYRLVPTLPQNSLKQEGTKFHHKVQI